LSALRNVVSRRALRFAAACVLLHLLIWAYGYWANLQYDDGGVGTLFFFTWISHILLIIALVILVISAVRRWIALETTSGE